MASIVFQPRLQTIPARHHLVRTFRSLEILKTNSERAIEALQERLDQLRSESRIQRQRHPKDFARLELVYRILNDVLTQQWRILEVDTITQSLRLLTPEVVEKDALRRILDVRRAEIITRDFEWISRSVETVRPFLIDGKNLRPERIRPTVEVCKNELQHTVFRFLRYTWSSPFSEYVGRRMRFLIRDAGNGGAVIGIAALGSSVMQIAERDKWIGWMPKTEKELQEKPKYWRAMRKRRAERIVSMMDMYVCGAIPPYSHLLGGKLICYIMASDKVRHIFKKKYKSQRTITKRRISHDLVLLATTSLYGSHSSQYNRIRLKRGLLYEPIGLTRGYGSVHLSSDTFDLMRRFLKRYGNEPSHLFGRGVNWKMRVIRECLNDLGLDQDLLLQHSYPRSIYVAKYAHNALEYLRGETDVPRYVGRPFDTVVSYWKERWLQMRLSNAEAITKMRSTKVADVIWRAYP